MSNEIPLKFYDIVDEYETEAASPVKRDGTRCAGALFSTAD